MSDQSNAKGNLHLPEFATIDQVIRTIKDKAQQTGTMTMATCVTQENLAYVVVGGNFDQISRLSRLLATLAASPLVQMPGKK